MVVFETAFSCPLGDSADALPVDALAQSLLFFRCDTAADTGMALSHVRITSGAPASASAATILDAIRIANAGVACPASRVLLAAVASDARALSAGGTRTYAMFAGSVDVSGSAALADAVAAAMASAAFPLTEAAWASAWHYTAAAWAAAFGTPPMQVVAGSIVIVAAASSSSPSPAAPTPSLTTSQQLGLGLGVGLSLACIVIAAVLRLACSSASRAARC